MKHIITLMLAAGMTLAAFAQTPRTVGVALQPSTSRVVGTGTNLFIANADRAVATVDTVARLATLTNAVHGSVVDVRGYDADQDLPYPIRFALNTNSVANTNRIVIANASGAGNWEHNWNGDIRIFGPMPGTTNGVGLQAAIDYALPNRIPIYLPGDANGGIYYTDRTLVITNLAGNQVRFSALRGDGASKSRILHTGYGEPVVRFRGQFANFEGLTVGYVNPQYATNDASACLRLDGFSAHVTLRDLQFKNGGYGIRNISDETGYTAFSYTIDNVTIEDCNIGIDWVSGSGSRIENVYIANYGLPYATRAILERAGGSTWDQINIEHSNWRGSPVVFAGDGTSVGLMHFEGNRLMNSEAILSIASSAVPVQLFRMVNNYFGGYAAASLTRSGTTATLTVDEWGDNQYNGHGFAVGDTIFVQGATDALYNGSFTVTGVTSSNLTYTMGGTPAADAVVNLSGGSDYISVNRTTAANVTALMQTENYNNPQLLVRSLMARDNRIIAAASGNRNGILAYNEFSGLRGNCTIDSVQLGSLFETNVGIYLAPIPVVAFKRESNIATVWSRQPHLLATNALVYFQANTPGIYPSTNWTVLTTPTPYSFTIALDGSDVAFTREAGFGTVFPVSAFITSKSRSSNIATVETDRSHNLKVGYKVTISRCSDGSFNSTTAVVLSVPSTTSFTYRSVSSDAGSSAESTGVLGVFDSGISEFLSTSTHYGLKKFGAWTEQITALSSNVIASGSYDLTTNSLVAARIGDVVTLAPVDPATWNPELLVTGTVLANNNLVVTRRNIGASSVTNFGGVWSVKLHRP